VIRYPGLVMALAWSVAIGGAVVLVPSQPAFGIVAAALAVPAVALAIVMRPALIALSVAVALLGVARVELPLADSAATQLRAAGVAGAPAVMSGAVADDARLFGGGGEVLIEPKQILIGRAPVSGIGNVLVRWRGPAEPEFGDTVVADGKLGLPRDTPDFDRRAYLAQKQVFLELQAYTFDVKQSGAGVQALAARLRARYTAALDAAIPPPHAAMLLGIVLGIHRGIPKALEDALIATGLIHLLVLSGLKVAVFARIVQGALAPILGRHGTWPAVGLIALYAMVGGATPAAVRASLMGGLVIAAAHIGRPSHTWTSLATAAAAMLGWEPELAWDVGFQLSFAGTAAIILLTPAISRRLPFLPHVLREPFAVTCAAQIGTVPMMAANFHVLSPIAPVANALTLPILPILVTAGFAIGAISIVPEIARLAAIPVTGLLWYIEQVGYVLAHVPAAAIPIASFPTWLGFAYFSSLAPAIAARYMPKHRRRFAIAGAVAAPILISSTGLAMWANAPPQAIVMNVGDGQAVLLRGPQGAVLIDGGPSPQRLHDELGTHLPPWQRDLDSIVISGPGLGHVGGLAGLERRARTVIIPAPGPLGAAWRAVAFDQVARGAAVRKVVAGDTIRAAGFELEILAPEGGVPPEETGAAQVALRATVGGRSLCTFGDLDLDAQTLAAARLPGGCSYVLLPSGGRSALSPDLERAAVSPSTQLIASRGPGRIAAAFLATVLRTDEEGTITLPL
jgi:competence protein ComEC